MRGLLAPTPEVDGMIFMAIAHVSSEVVAIIASLALLTPLVRAIHKWHMDVRKTAKPGTTGTPLQSQTAISPQGSSRWSRMGVFERVRFISNLITFAVCGFTLVGFLFLAPVTPATSRDVVMIGLLVCMVIVTSRSDED